MTTPDAFQTATVLHNGQVLAAGGETQNNKGAGSVTASAELYTPRPRPLPGAAGGVPHLRKLREWGL